MHGPNRETLDIEEPAAKQPVHKIKFEGVHIAIIRPTHTRTHVAGTCSGDMLQRQFPRVTTPFLQKGSVAGTEL